MCCSLLELKLGLEAFRDAISGRIKQDPQRTVGRQEIKNHAFLRRSMAQLSVISLHIRHTYTNIYAYTYTYVYIHVKTCTNYSFIYIYTRHKYSYMCMYKYVYVYIYIYIYIYLYIYITYKTAAKRVRAPLTVGAWAMILRSAPAKKLLTSGRLLGSKGLSTYSRLQAVGIHGPGTIHAGFPSSPAFGVKVQSYANFLASTAWVIA